MVICKVCNKHFHYVSNTHVKTHNLTLRQYIEKYGNNIKSISYKKKAYKNHSKMMSKMRKNGIVTPPLISLENRKKLSVRMKENNPMKNPEIVRKVREKMKGRKIKPRTLEQRLNISRSKSGSLNPRWTGGEKVPVYLLWNKDRKLALQRDKNCCVKCGMTNDIHKKKYKKSLHVHHIESYRKSKNNSLDNLITLCVACHIKEEARVKLLQNI